jgi:alpha-beta hydrolase superfamily lysophospholipase
MTASPNFPKLPHGWVEQTYYIHNDQLFLRLYQNTQPQSRRGLFILHGHSEQGDRYEHFPYYLQNTVDNIVLMDLPGHGRSKGFRGHIKSFDEYQDAFLLAHQFINNEVLGQGFQFHWLGHSLGATILLKMLMNQSLPEHKSVICSAPILELAFPVPEWKRKLALFIEPILGMLPMTNEADYNFLTHDMSVVEYWEDSPYNHKTVTPSFYVAFLREMEWLKTQKGPVATHLHFMIPMKDRIANSAVSIQCFDRIRSPQRKKLLTKYDNFFHEIFSEIQKEKAFQDLSNWLESID